MVNTRSKFKKTQQQSGTLVGSSDDLLIEILLRLPVTSVLRFKSVSKHWGSLLSHPPFTLLYHNGSISPGLFIKDLYIPFDVENRSPPPFRKLDFYPDRHGIKILQSCNGLLLCCSKNVRDQRDCKYYVFNPTTKQFALIPSVPGGGNVHRTIRFMGLAYHQTECVNYKVVCIRHVKRDEELFQIQIYSSDTQKWKIVDTFSAPYSTDFREGVYWHQAFHWFSSLGNRWYLKVDTEELKPMPLPGSFTFRRPAYFGESRGHLHLVETVRCNLNQLHLNVYEMLNHHSGWFVKYRVELDEMIGRYRDLGYPEYYKFDHTLDVVRGEEEDETFLVIRIQRKIIRYNVQKKNFKEIFDIHEPFYNFEVHRYIETLVSF